MSNEKETPILRTIRPYMIDIKSDLASIPDTVATLAVNKNGTTEEHIDTNGADYIYAQIDYVNGEEIYASRTIAKIQPGKHTEPAFWTDIAPSIVINTHQGEGELIIGNPDTLITQEIPIDYQTNNLVTLPPGHFYIIQAAPHGKEEMIVSSLHRPPPDWEKAEITFPPGQSSIFFEGEKKVPPTFQKFITTNP